jgi:transcription antitermination protein NusB
MTTQRTRAREVALQLLFQHDQRPDAAREDVARYVREQLPEPELGAFALALFDGAVANLPAIDEGLARSAEKWAVGRMAAIDRNVLRLGAYELTHVPETPAAVVLNEAIELARRFGSADSPGFVNGVLDRFRRDHVKAAEPALPAPPAEAPPPPAALPEAPAGEA